MSNLRDAARKYSDDGITSDGQIIRCGYCEKPVNCVTKGIFDINRIKIHVNGDKHRESKAKRKSSKQRYVNKVEYEEEQSKPSSSKAVSFEDMLAKNDEIKYTKKKSNKVKSSPTEKVNSSLDATVSLVPAQGSRKRESSLNNEFENSSKSRKINNDEIVPKSSLPKLLITKQKLKPLNSLDILSSLSEDRSKTSNNGSNRMKVEAERECSDLARFTSRKGRTAVFSGQARTAVYTHVLRLEDLCIRVLMDNIDKITCLGTAPYWLIKPVLEKCNPRQLFKLEDYNPGILEDDDEIWEYHCRREFKNEFPDDEESWREFYIRSEHGRDQKLKHITANINRSMMKATPVRKTQLAYVDSVAKPPRNILNKQVKNGTATMSRVCSVPPLKGNSGSSNRVVPQKKTKAPLMAKTIQIMKNRFLRR